jgi:hypothetical protein
MPAPVRLVVLIGSAAMLAAGCSPPPPLPPPRMQPHTPVSRRDSVAETGTMMYTMARHTGEYGGSLGRLPSTFEPIVEAHPHVWVWQRYANGADVWGRPVRYSPDGTRFELRSAGPDGVFDTADDIVMMGMLGRDRPCSSRNEYRSHVFEPPCPAADP